MGKIRIGRLVATDDLPALVRDRLLRWADLYGFKVDRSDDQAVELRRGSRLGGWTSFDVQNTPTRLSAQFRRTPGGTEVTISLICASWGSIFLAGDRATLEKQLDVLAGTLRGQ